MKSSHAHSGLFQPSLEADRNTCDGWSLCVVYSGEGDGGGVGSADRFPFFLFLFFFINF